MVKNIVGENKGNNVWFYKCFRQLDSGCRRKNIYYNRRNYSEERIGNRT